MMSCTRYQGLMLQEHLIDMEAGYGEMWSLSRRCVNCGHRDDASSSTTALCTQSRSSSPMP